MHLRPEMRSVPGQGSLHVPVRASSVAAHDLVPLAEASRAVSESAQKPPQATYTAAELTGYGRAWDRAWYEQLDNTMREWDHAIFARGEGCTEANPCPSPMHERSCAAKNM